MPLPEHEESYSKGKRLFKERQPGEFAAVDGNPTRDFINSQTEHNFRQKDAQAAIQAAPPPPAASPAQQFSQPQPPSQPLGPDRYHKWGGNDVILRKKHYKGDDPVPDGGYAHTVHDAWMKCQDLVAKLNPDGSDGRVTLIVGDSGTYKEDFLIDTSLIDVVSPYRATILGQTIVMPVVRQLTLSGLRLQNGKDYALDIQGGGVDFAGYRSNIRLHDLDVVAAWTSFKSDRRFYASECDFRAYLASDWGDEKAAIWCTGAVADFEHSEMQRCNVYSYATTRGSEFGIVKGNRFDHYAIKASVRNPLGLGPQHGYIVGTRIDDGAENYYLKYGGLLLNDCYVHGGLLCEGWRVGHRGGAQYGGIPAIPDSSGLVYATQRGIWLFDDLNGAYGHQGGDIFFDNTNTYSSAVARCVPDPEMVGSPYVWGGRAWYRNTHHHADQVVAAPVAPFFYAGAPGTAYIVGSSATPCAQWGSGVVIINETGMSTGVLSSALWDPFNMENS